LAGSGSKRN
jgi:hypothetical protein